MIGTQQCPFRRLNFLTAIDHRTSNFVGRLAAACPKGIDVYFENVGGAVFQAVFPLLNPFARIPVCGLISMYNATSLSPGSILLPHLMRAILTKRLTFRGFIVSDFSARYRDFMRNVSAWVREGRIKYREDVVEGLENAPRALIGLLRGEGVAR
jgi:NADPH-dependent curcumin reductase CurA